MTPGDGTSCTFLLRRLRRLGPSKVLAVILPRKILFHNSTSRGDRKRNGVHHGLVRGGGVSTVVKLPTGVFFNANVPALVVILGRRHSGSSILVVSTSGNFIGRKGGGGLHRYSVGHVTSAMHRQGAVPKCSHAISHSRVHRGNCGLGVPHCMSSDSPIRGFSVCTAVFKNVPRDRVSRLRGC